MFKADRQLLERCNGKGPEGPIPIRLWRAYFRMKAAGMVREDGDEAWITPKGKRALAAAAPEARKDGEA